MRQQGIEQHNHVLWQENLVAWMQNYRKRIVTPNCDAKLPDQQNCVFALTKAVHP
jgi:hypothetical protein